MKLLEPRPGFLSVLARFQLSVVPHEAVERYGPRFARHPVGTGPYTLAEEDWTDNAALFRANPDYHASTAEEPLPRTAEVRYTFYSEDAPLWLEYTRQAGLDAIQIPSDNLEQALTVRTRTLKKAFADEGHRLHWEFQRESIHFGFNMEDPVVGGDEPEQRKLRQALCLAADLQEINEVIFKGLALIYEGVVPPGLLGPSGEEESPGPSNLGPDLDRARALLAEAGFPGGEGLPELEFCLSDHPKARQQIELLARQLARIGVKLRLRTAPFKTVQEWMKKKQAQMFSQSWRADYPDAASQLSYFYGPHASPGINATNYRNADYDRAFESIRHTPPSPERDGVCKRMRERIVEDCPMIGSLARTRFYLARPWLKNFHPTEDYYNWVKYLELVDR